MKAPLKFLLPPPQSLSINQVSAIRKIPFNIYERHPENYQSNITDSLVSLSHMHTRINTHCRTVI